MKRKFFSENEKAGGKNERLAGTGEPIFRKITVRPLRKREIPAARKLVWESFSRFVAPSFGEEGVKNFRTFLSDDFQKTELYGVFAGIRLKGVLAVRERHVRAFFVKAGQQGKGYGGALMRRYLETAGGDVTVNASSYGVPAYKALGFVPLGGEQEKNGMKFTPMKFPAQKE